MTRFAAEGHRKSYPIHQRTLDGPKRVAINRPFEAVTPRLPSRPERLSEKYERAADTFDEEHVHFVGRANDALRTLAPDSAIHQASFGTCVREVFRERYRVDEPPAAIQAHKLKERKKKKWTIFESVWADRAKTSDARDFYDAPRAKQMAFEHDWAKALGQHALDKKLERAVKKLPAEAVAASSVLAMREALFSHFDLVYRSFNYYAALGSGDDLFAISRTAYAQFVADCALAVEDMMGMRGADLNILFEGVNAKQSKDDQFNHRKTLSREEWLALLIQIVLTRHVTSEDALPIGDAIDRFAADMRVGLGAGCLHDPNSFRSDQCYTESTDYALKANGAALRLVYDVFAYGTGAIGDAVYSTKLMDYGEYSLLIDRLMIVDQFVTARDVDQAFIQSRMLVVDEETLKGRSRLVQLRYEDFLEAIVRLAYRKAMPTDDEISQTSSKHAGEYLAWLAETPQRELDFCQDRTRRRFSEPLEQPIASKVRHFVAWLIHRIRGGAHSDKELSKKQVELFHAGHVKISARIATEQAPPTLGAEVDDPGELIRVGGPSALAEESEYRSSAGS